MTEDLITKMGKASEAQIKEAEEAAKAEEQQELNKTLNKQVKLQQLLLKAHNN